jgi:hypothetical protein
MLSHITPFLAKKNKVDGFDLPFSLKPTNVNFILGFSKINVLNSVAA